MYGDATSIVAELLLRSCAGELESARALLDKPLESLQIEDFKYLAKITSSESPQSDLSGEALVDHFEKAVTAMLDGTASATLPDVSCVFLRHFVAECIESPIDLSNNVRLLPLHH